MSEADTDAWVRAGLWGLPGYGLLTFFTTLDPQPDPARHYDAWARYVTTDTYVLAHVLGSALGLVLATFGTVALGAYLARTRSGRLAMGSMVMTVVGLLLFLLGMGVSAFAAPMQGQAHLAGLELDDLPESFAGTVQSMVGLVMVVLLFVGNVLLGVAVWRSRALPRGPAPCGSSRPCSCTRSGWWWPPPSPAARRAPSWSARWWWFSPEGGWRWPRGAARFGGEPGHRCGTR